MWNYHFNDGEIVSISENLYEAHDFEEDCCIRCGTFSNWAESCICNECDEMLVETTYTD
jgi:hypothetical protein